MPRPCRQVGRKCQHCQRLLSAGVHSRRSERSNRKALADTGGNSATGLHSQTLSTAYPGRICDSKGDCQCRWCGGWLDNQKMQKRGLSGGKENRPQTMDYSPKECQCLQERQKAAVTYPRKSRLLLDREMLTIPKCSSTEYAKKGARSSVFIQKQRRTGGAKRADGVPRSGNSGRPPRAHL